MIKQTDWIYPTEPMVVIRKDNKSIVTEGITAYKYTKVGMYIKTTKDPRTCHYGYKHYEIVKDDFWGDKLIETLIDRYKL